MIKLFDRIKEISHSTGTGVFILDQAANGFSRFNEVYANGDVLFYAITDGTSYEVGSGVYSSNQITQRFPFRSSNSDQRVNFPNGVKEVYVSYPAKYAVHTASGYGDFQQPQSSGLAFWRNPTTLDYDSNLIWDKSNNMLGISKTPQWPLDVAGLTKTSGLIVDRSGVWFSGGNLGYTVGVQLEPFLKNQLNVQTGTDAVFQLSGIVNQGWLFKKQSAGLVFAGPPSGCGSPPCPQDYPSFRGITIEDIPDLSDLYVTQYGDGVQSNIALYRESGVIEFDAYLTWDKTYNYLGVNKTSPAKALDVVGEGRFTSHVNTAGDLGVSGLITTHTGLHFASGNTYPVGLLAWSDDDGTLKFKLKGGTVDLSIGQSNIALCYNGVGVSLTKGQVVYVSGQAQGQRPKINLASASGEYMSSKTIGVVSESISNGSEGFITTFGLMRGFNTSAFLEGSGLWLSTTPGSMTMTRPQAPNHGVFVGWCINSHASAGEIFVNIQNGYEIEELHNVLIESLASGDILQYDSSNGTWKNRQISGGGGGGGDWTIADQGGNNELISTQTVYFSGTKGIETYWDMISNTLIINPTALSGYFESKITGGGGGGGGDWTISDQANSSELISTQTVYFSGSKGISTSYNPSTNVLSIDPTAISGYFQSISDIGIYGKGDANKLAFFNGTRNISSDTNLHWDNANKRLGIATSAPTQSLHVSGNARLTGALFDSLNLPGTSGQVLVSTSGGVEWRTSSGATGPEGPIGPAGPIGPSGATPPPSGWTISDAQGNSEYIVNNIVYFSGVKGISTSYNTSTNILQIDPTSISGYFENKINGIGATTYTTGSGLTLIGTQFNTAGSGNFDTVILNKTSVPQLVATSGIPPSANTIVNASGLLTIPVFNTFSDGYGAIGSGASYNKGVLFFTADSGRLYISSGSGWLYSSFTHSNVIQGGVFMRPGI